MSMFRRFGSLALVALFSASLGCSNEVKIGAVISESGSVATYGIRVKRGLDLALEEINAAGGFKGGTVSLAYRDDSTNASQGEQVTRELIETERVDVIIGAVSSAVTLRIAPICEEEGVVLLSPSSTVPSLSQIGDYIFRNCPSDILEGTAMAKFAKEQGFERMVIFVLDNEFGAELADVFTQQYESRFRQVVETFSFPPGMTEGFEEMAGKVKNELKPDAIYIISYDQELVPLLTTLHDAGVDCTILGTSSVTDNIGRLAGDAAEKLVYPQVEFDANSTDPAVAKFVQSYKAKYDAVPEIYSAYGYDALKLILRAMTEMDSTHPDNVKIGLSSIKNWEGAAGLTTFDENGDVVRYPRLFIIREGEKIPYKQFVDEGLSLFDGG